jgi:hypothetical protein
MAPPLVIATPVHVTCSPSDDKPVNDECVLATATAIPSSIMVSDRSLQNHQTIPSYHIIAALMAVRQLSMNDGGCQATPRNY